jgi:hypothetical protein
MSGKIEMKNDNNDDNSKNRPRITSFTIHKAKTLDNSTSLDAFKPRETFERASLPKRSKYKNSFNFFPFYLLK